MTWLTDKSYFVGWVVACFCVAVQRVCAASPTEITQHHQRFCWVTLALTQPTKESGFQEFCQSSSIMTHTLKVIDDTWLKLSPAQSTTLPNNQKQVVSSGTLLPISSYEIVGDHLKVSLGDDAEGKQLAYQGHNT